MLLYPIKHIYWEKKKPHLSIRTKQTKTDPDNNFQQIYQITLQNEQKFHFFFLLKQT